MKTKFTFDKKTGTMVESNNIPIDNNENNNDILKTNATESTTTPVFKEEKKMDVKPTSTAFEKQIVQMQRVNKPTPIQLVDNDGKPESYLDSITTGIMLFRERQDYDICQIADEKTGKILAYIGGYGLQINFNMAELRTMEKIEQCLQGLTKLFRHYIMTQNLGGQNKTE